MSDEDILFTAKMMIVAYGQDAEVVADGTAKTRADRGEILEMMSWSRVADKIAEMQPRARLSTD